MGEGARVPSAPPPPLLRGPWTSTTIWAFAADRAYAGPTTAWSHDTERVKVQAYLSMVRPNTEYVSPACSNAEKLIKEHCCPSKRLLPWWILPTLKSQHSTPHSTSSSRISYSQFPRVLVDLQWALPLVIGTWGSKSYQHRDSQISAKNRIRILRAIARSNYTARKYLFPVTELCQLRPPHTRQFLVGKPPIFCRRKICSDRNSSHTSRFFVVRPEIIFIDPVPSTLIFLLFSSCFQSRFSLADAQISPDKLSVTATH